MDLQRGNSHGCALFASGVVRCWGSNEDGQLGLGSTENIGDGMRAGEPVALQSITRMAAGGYTTCAISAGQLQCWGSNDEGHLGLGNSVSLVDKPGQAAMVSLGVAVPSGVVTGESNACALFDTGSVRCWGATGLGQLGNKNVDLATIGQALGDDEMPTSDANDVVLGGNATQVSIGTAHLCALLDDGSVRCWGSNEDGQLGLGSTTPVGITKNPAEMPTVALGKPATQVVAFGYSTCALLADTTVHCWGSNEFGQLGLGSTTKVGDKTSKTGDFAADTLVHDVQAMQLSAYNATVCALLTSGQVRCWGYQASGDLGLADSQLSILGDDEAVTSVAPIDIKTRALQVAVGEQAVCARLETGNVRCWGYGNDGELGYPLNGNIGDNETPAKADDVF